MLNAAITCARNSPANGRHCEPLYLDTTDPAELPAAIAKALAEAGWREIDGEHYCPRHNPADVGEPMQVSEQYMPFKDTGWEIRVPPSERADIVSFARLEIRRIPSAQANDD